MTAHDDAVKAAAEAIDAAQHAEFPEWSCDGPECRGIRYYRPHAEAAVAAAAPTLLAAERDRIAAAIRRLGETPQIEGALVLPLHPLVLDYIEAAALIAETAPEEGS